MEYSLPLTEIAKPRTGDSIKNLEPLSFRSLMHVLNRFRKTFTKTNFQTQPLHVKATEHDREREHDAVSLYKLNLKL